MKKRSDGRFRGSYCENGVRVYFYSSAKTEREAQREINRKILEYQTNKNKTSTDFNKLFDKWLTEYSETVTFNSFYKSRAKFERVRDYFDGCNIETIDNKSVNGFINSQQHYATKTIKCTVSILSTFLDWCIGQNVIESNPCRNIKIKKGHASTRRTLPCDDDIQKIKSAVDDGVFGLFAFMLLYTGMRKGEALALTWDDIDIKNGIIHINKTVVFSGSRPFVQPFTKTEAGKRDIVILKPLENVLRKTHENTSKIVFTVDGCDYITNSQYSRGWTKYCKIHDIHATAHELRHAYATMLVESGISEFDATALMGHKSIQTTHSIYAHIREQRMNDAQNKLNEYINNSSTW